MASASTSTRTTSKHAILVGTDFSKCADTAVERAIRIAKEARAPIHVVHAGSRLPRALVKSLLGGRDEHAEKAALEGALRRAKREGVSAHGHIVNAAPTNALRTTARTISAALIVVGARGRALPDTFVGSTAERIAASVRVPVLLVRKPAHHAYRQVIIAAGASANLRAEIAASALVAPSASISIVHAYEGPFENTLRLHGANAASIQSYRRQSRREARAALTERLNEAGVDPGKLVLRHGDPRGVIEREQSRSRDALVVIERGRSPFTHVLLGSVTRSIIAHGSSDVLIV